VSFIRFLRGLLSPGSHQAPESRVPPKRTSAFTNLNLNAGEGEPRIQPDLRKARLVEPILVDEFTGESCKPFVCEDRLYIFTDSTGYQYDERGKRVRHFPLPERLFFSYVVERDLYLVQGSSSSYLWQPSTAEFLALKHQVASVKALAWVGTKVVIWSQDPEDDDGYHGEKSYYTESVRVLDPTTGEVTRPRDQSMGGLLVMHDHGTRYSRTTSSRLSPESKFEFAADDPVGFSGTCGITPGRKSGVSLFFSDEPPNGLEIGLPDCHLSAFPRFPQHPGHRSNGYVTGNWAFTGCSVGDHHTVAAWYDEGLQVLACSNCGNPVWIRSVACKCAHALPDSGVQPDSIKPGQIRFHRDFETLWRLGIETTPSDVSLDHIAKTYPTPARVRGFVVGVQQYGKLGCFLSPELGLEEPLFSTELRPYYGTTFRNAILDPENRCLWVLNCDNGPLRFTLDPRDPGFGGFATDYQTEVRKPESYYSFLDLLLHEDLLFVQGDFFMVVCQVKEARLKHLVTTPDLGMSNGWQLSSDQAKGVLLTSKTSTNRVWDVKARRWRESELL
jgi:hypothetical protein